MKKSAGPSSAASPGSVMPRQCGHLSSGRRSSAISLRPLRSTGPRMRSTASALRLSSRRSRPRTSSDIESATSKRTAHWKRRWRSSISTAVSRSSASSSLRVRSALRVTRKAWCSSTSMPVNSMSRCDAMRSSRATNRVDPSLVGTQRRRVLGTLTRANRSSASAGSRISTARFSDRSEMNGNGCPGSTASGVSTGNTHFSKCSRSRRRSSSSSASGVSRFTPSAARAGLICSSNSRCCSQHSSEVTRRTSRSCWAGVSPSMVRSVSSAATRSASPDTRTWKNSSRLVEKMLRNLAFSSRGTSGSSARARTRALKASQEISRLK